MADKSHLIGVEIRILQHVINHESHIGNAARDPTFGSRRAFVTRHVRPEREFRNKRLRMIHGRDNIAMTAYVLTQEARSPAIPATEMRVNNERMGAGRGGIPDLTFEHAIS